MTARDVKFSDAINSIHEICRSRSSATRCAISGSISARDIVPEYVCCLAICRRGLDREEDEVVVRIWWRGGDEQDLEVDDDS